MDMRIAIRAPRRGKRSVMKQKAVKVTLKTIAEQAGTSIGTVDRAIRNRPGIHPDTKERVLGIVQALGYKPSRFPTAPGRARPVRIGLAYPLEPPSFYADIDRGIDAAAKELLASGVAVEKIRYNRQNHTEQTEALCRISAGQYDGLAVNAAGRSSSLEIDRLSRSGTPVITFNTDAPESQRRFYIGNDSLQSGRMGAELLSRFLGGLGGVTVLGNFIQINPFSERFGGFCEVIHTEYPDIVLYPCADCQSVPDVAMKNMLTAISQVPSMRGVFCTGHSSTIGAIAALKELGRKDIVLVGFDVGGGSLDALRDGWADALLFQDPFRQAYTAAHLLARHVLEGWLPETPLLHVETSIVIKNNISAYENRDALLGRRV